MFFDFTPPDATLPDDEEYSPLVERIFYSPKRVPEGEYITIYEFLLNDPEIRDDPQAIAGVLKEFAGWSQHMLEQMQQLGLIEQ